jgi:hypothetical protein
MLVAVPGNDDPRCGGLSVASLVSVMTRFIGATIAAAPFVFSPASPARLS